MVTTQQPAVDGEQVQRRLEITDRMASLGTLSAGLAHEINNPLAVVIANTDYLRAELDDLRAQVQAGTITGHAMANRLEDLAQIQAEVGSAGSRIGKIVADLRDFLRPGEPDTSDADVGRAIQWAVRATAHELRNRARLVHAADDLPPVRADEARLGHVFMNLLRNAAQAIAPGRQGEHEVAIRGRAERDLVIIEVHDTGAGIHPDHLARIFEPFFTTRTTGDRAGLGLSVCHGIVTSLGGALEVESELGRGTTFRVSLRALPVNAAPRPPPPVAPVQRRTRILVVDDDAMIHRTMQRLLRDHDVTCVDGGRHALDVLARGEQFDVIFSDLMMPGMTGVEFHRALHARTPELARRIVFVTGGACATSGAEEFLRTVDNLTVEKPFSQTELRAAIARTLAGRAAR